MKFRRDPIYVSTEVSRALWILARAERRYHDPTTADEMADRLLRKAIEEKHPQLFEHQKRIDELEAKLIGDLAEEASIDQPEPE